MARAGKNRRMAGGSLSPDERDRLLAEAKRALQSAYAPYSDFKVGAAVLTHDGKIFTGCNVENASYGLTICAERAAIFSAVAASQGKKLVVRAVAVVNKNEVACSPCGACRQVIAEFGPDAIVIFQAQEGYKQALISELLPHSFRL